MSQILSTPFGPEKDQFYMKKALLQASRAFGHGEVPVGAIVINGQGDIIARGYNRIEASGFQNEHAEVRALRRAAKKKGDWRLIDCWLYVTLEPCPMCIGLIKLSRLAGVVFGSTSPLFGFQLDTDDAVPLYKKNALSIIAGIGAGESKELLKQFFKQKRMRRD